MPQLNNALLNTIPDGTAPNVPLNQTSFSRGVITLVDQSKLPRNALKEANNLTLAEDGAPTIRPGTNWYGSVMPNGQPIDGGAMYVATDDTVHLLAVAGGSVYRSLNDGLTWTLLTTDGGSTTPFTAGKKAGFEQANAYGYLFNGWDNIVRYDGTTILQTYTALSTPIAISATKTGLGGTGIYTLRYRVAAVNNVGYTIASVAQTVLVDRARDQFDATNFVTFQWNAVTGALRYDIYVGQTAGDESYIDSTDAATATTYLDKGAAIEQVSVTAPDANTTTGPRAGDMAMIGSRLYATQDRDYPYRVWISGAGKYVGQFSSAYDATYIDLQKGGQFKPVCVKDYRKGNNDPVATVWCRSKDGRGCIWQGTLEAFTVGNITFPVPNFFKLPGSRGTDAPYSVINVLNDYMYYNSQAYYNLGSRAQFLNLLSTDEVSANIRPDVKFINPAAASGIASHFQDAKVYFSVPTGSSTVNNQTTIFDTERKAWLPKAFTIGFERFFAYTDSTPQQGRHTLCWKTGDTRFTEISSNIRGDYGAAFATSLITGLIHVNPKNRFEFLWCEEAEVEFALPQDNIEWELSGITRTDGFKSIIKRNIVPTTTKKSWTLHSWGHVRWSYKGNTASSFSEPSLKRFSSVQEDINAYQFAVRTNSLMANYVLRTLQINGQASESGKPREWELFS